MSDSPESATLGVTIIPVAELAKESWSNPFRHTIETDSARLAPSAPSTANARLQVTGSTCRLAGSLPASRQYSDRPGFDGLDRAGRGFFMTDDVAEELLVAAEVIAGFRCARV